MAATEGPDVLSGGAGRDTIEGLGGDDTLFGHDGIDHLYGGGGDDTLYGGAENDDLYGGDGDDTLYGGADHDDLYGGGGDDVLYGGADSDDLYGGDGDDTLYGGEGAEEMHGGAGDDLFIIGVGEGGSSLSPYCDVFYGGDGIDRIRSASGDLHLELDNRARLDPAGLLAGIEFLEAGSGPDGGPGRLVLHGIATWLLDLSQVTLVNIDAVVGGYWANIRGGEADETFLLESGQVEAGGGDDRISISRDYWSRRRTNMADGGDGDDVFSGAAKVDWRGGRGRDVFDASEGMHAGSTYESVERLIFRNAEIEGHGVVDLNVFEEREISGWLTAGDGDTTLIGTDGDDLLRSAVGRDVLYGGAGNDRLDVWSAPTRGRPGAEVDSLYGGAGDDEFRVGHDVDSFRRGSVGALIGEIDGGEGHDRLVILRSIRLDESSRIHGVEETTIADWAEIELGGDGTFDLATLSGIEGLPLHGDKGDQTVHGTVGRDQLAMGAGADEIFGGRGHDRIAGNAGDDRLFGGAGRDVIVCGSGADEAFGGAGADVFVLGGPDHGAGTMLDGGAGFDVLRLASGSKHRSLLEADVELRSIERIEGEGGDLRIIGEGRLDLSGVRGLRGIETITSDGARQEIVGTARDDVFLGARGGDRIFGGEGDDVFLVTGRRGLSGAKLIGGEGTDTLVSGQRDAIAANVTLISIERLEAEKSTVRVSGRGDFDLSVFERVVGVENLVSIGAAKTLRGGDGDDRIFAGLHGDWIYGGGGDDLLIAGDASAVLNGGEGRDVFRFSIEDRHVDGLDWKIQDFEGGVDHLIFARAGSMPRKPQLVDHFKDGGGFQIRLQVNEVQLDLDGDGREDARVLLENDHVLTPDDLLI